MSVHHAALATVGVTGLAVMGSNLARNLARHDHEFEEVRWIPFSEAASLLTFETERALVARAASLLAGMPSRPDPHAQASGPTSFEAAS